MSLHFYKTTIKEIKKETNDCVSIEFIIPNDQKELFQYKAGQYINVKATINDEEVRRSYSICTAPFENSLTIAVKKVNEGVFSTFANSELKRNDVLEIMPPLGNFILPEKINEIDTYIFYGAGSGITPIISLIKTVLHDSESNVILYYGNKNAESIIFKDEIENLKAANSNRFDVHMIFSKDIQEKREYNGRIDKNKAEYFEKNNSSPSARRSYYLCGPQTMVEDVKQKLIDLGNDPLYIHTELFNTTNEIDTKQNLVENKTDVSQSHITIELEGQTYEFDYDSSKGNILDAALAIGADLPYSCKGGVCSTCKAKCESGSVSMKLNYTLDPDEVENGYILTCQSVPVSDQVFISFDS